MRAVVLCLLAVATAGCDTRTTLPTGPASPAVLPSAAPAYTPYVDPGFPPAPAGAEVYGRTSPSAIPGIQRYVLLVDGTFRLQYLGPGRPFSEYAGSCRRDGAAAVFTFGPNPSDVWFATAAFEGDRMDVRYSLEMLVDGFDDGTYEAVR